MMTELLAPGVYRLKVPFENIYTSVFILTDGEKTFLFDCATSKEDVENYILPALRELGRTPDLLILSHSHGDHAGRAELLLSAFPRMLIAFMPREHRYPAERVHYLVDGERLGRYEIIHLPGHDRDCLAVLDRNSMTLLSADCLQLHGVGRYGASFLSYADYMRTIERARALNVQRIVASHDYAPLGFSAAGAAEVNAWLDECAAIARELRVFALSHREMDMNEAAARYNAAHAGMPPVGGYVLAGILREES